MAGTKTEVMCIFVRDVAYRTFVRFYMCLPKIIGMLKTRTGIYVKTLMLLKNSLSIFSFFIYLFADAQPRKHCALLWPSNRGLDCVPFPRILHRRRAVRPNW